MNETRGGDEMGEDEARRVLGILSTADGGCRYCVRDLLEQFVCAFPQFKTLAESMYGVDFKDLAEILYGPGNG